MDEDELVKFWDQYREIRKDMKPQLYSRHLLKTNIV